MASRRGPKIAKPSPTLSIDIDLLPVAAIANHDRVFFAVNRAYVELTGWTAEDVVGKTMPELMTKLVAPKDRAVLHRSVGRARPIATARGS